MKFTKHKTRLTALLTAAVLLAAMLPAAFAAEEDTGFQDVDPDAWYAGAVGFAVGRELMSGYNDESFGPTDTLKRSMLAQVFYSWEQRPYSGEGEEKPWAGDTPFADVAAGVWYEDAVNWARSEKVMMGEGTEFAPDRDLNRQEMAVALYGFAGYKGVDRGDTADLSGYAGSDSVASWAAQAMSWALSRDMLHIEDNTLAPTAPAQRAELAYALMQLAHSDSEADQLRLLAGARIMTGVEMKYEDCAIIIQYHFHPWDWPDSGELPMDEVVERAEALAAANGCVPMTAQGEGSSIYAVGEPWSDGVALVVLGKEDTLHPGVQAAAEGRTQRFAQAYDLWEAEDWDCWMVYEVDEMDYYEEDGEQHPCFVITLLPA